MSESYKFFSNFFNVQNIIIVIRQIAKFSPHKLDSLSISKQTNGKRLLSFQNHNSSAQIIEAFNSKILSSKAELARTRRMILKPMHVTHHPYV